VTELQEARSRLEKQEYREVAARLEPLVEKLRADLGEPGVPPGRRLR
jgi:hypothetical protein